jgi:hypothetical protein
MWAVCPLALRLSTYTPPRVLFVCNWLQVLRINTAPNAAEMVNLHAMRYRTPELFIRQPMGVFDPAVNPELSVSVTA